MLGVDLTVPIVILALAVGIVLSLRAAVVLAERRTEERTQRLLRDLGLDAPREVKGEAPAAGGPDEEPGSQP